MRSWRKQAAPTLTFEEAVKRFNEWNTKISQSPLTEEDRTEALNLNKTEFNRFISDSICSTYRH